MGTKSGEIQRRKGAYRTKQQTVYRLRPDIIISIRKSFRIRLELMKLLCVGEATLYRYLRVQDPALTQLATLELLCKCLEKDLEDLVLKVNEKKDSDE